MDARKIANDIMDEACLPEAFAKNGLDKAIRDRIVSAVEQTYSEAHECGRRCGREELQRSFRSLLGDH